jgi:2-octaprenyl-6-methoxyphenol hydroxylase
MKEYVVVGGGVIGLSLVLELINKVIDPSDSVTLITPEDLSNPKIGNNSNKIIALSDINYEFIASLGLNVEGVKINSINMIDGDYVCKFNAGNIGLGCLGYCVSWQDIYIELCKKICTLNKVKIIQKKIEYESELLEIADKVHHVFLCDGGNIHLAGTSFDEYDYQQDMVICRGVSNDYQNGEAFELFTTQGALAVLPYKNQVICLFSLSKNVAQNFTKDPARLHQLIKHNVSKYVNVEFENDEIVCYPLKLRYLTKNCHSKITFLGNAAHTIHPIMAQGLNLGLKNLQLLIKILKIEGVHGISSYIKVSRINILKTAKLVHWLALYSKNNNRFSRGSIIKSILWRSFAKLPLVQKIFFAFLQY